MNLSPEIRSMSSGPCRYTKPGATLAAQLELEVAPRLAAVEEEPEIPDLLHRNE